MSGHVSGVATKIREVEPSAIYVHCFAHSTNLCLQTLGRLSECIHNTLEFVMGVAQLIRYSPKRSSLFDTLRSQVSYDTPTLKPLCPTRWTVRTGAINAILTNYEMLMEALEIIKQGKDEYAMKANGYLTQMEQFSVFFGLKLAHLIFAATEQLSLTLQAKDTNIAEGLQAAKLTKSYLEKQRTDAVFDAFYSCVLTKSKDLTFDPVLPRQRRPPRRVDACSTSSVHVFPTPKDFFRKQYYDALDTAIMELDSRFNQRDTPFVAQLENLLLNAANNSLNPDEHEDTLAKISQFYSRDLDCHKLQNQLVMLPEFIKVYNENNPKTCLNSISRIHTVCEVMNTMPIGKQMFTEVANLLRLFLTIPVTTSTAERSFSALRRLKSYLRSTMTQVRLNNVMILHIHKGRTDDIDVFEIAKSFVSVNDRRRAFFGTF